MAVSLPLPPGYVSAFLFVLFDLIVLTALDTSLARLACRIYYTHMYAGSALPLRHLHLPSITSNLLGRSYLRPPFCNLAALLAKLTALAAILYVDVSLDATARTSYTNLAIHNAYRFDASDAAWPWSTTSFRLRSVQRAWQDSARCREVNDTTGSLNYYAPVYNLENGAVVTDDAIDVQLPSSPDTSASASTLQDALLSLNFTAIDASSLVCARPSLVHPSDARPLLSVTSCAGLPPDAPDLSSCYDRVDDSVLLDLPLLSYYVGDQLVPEGTAGITSQIFSYPPSIFSSTLPEAGPPDSSLVCSRTRAGGAGGTIVMTCLLVVPRYRNASGTLLDLWRYDQRSLLLSRAFRGPVFNTTVEIGLSQAANILFPKWTDPVFDTLSASVIADASVHTRLDSPATLRVARPGPPPIVSLLPDAAVVVAAGLVAATLLLSVVSAVMWRGDKRPPLNSVDGLSSIAREEAAPKEQKVGSLVRGDPVQLGITRTRDGALKFGPVVPGDIVVHLERSERKSFWRLAPP